MLELLIGLFLVGIVVLPLAQIPMKALKEQTKSAYRMQLHHYADLAFAEFKEQLYRQEISWKQICSPRNDKSFFELESVTIDLDSLKPRTFERTATFFSIGKKGKKGEDIRLVTFKVSFTTNEKKFRLFRGEKKDRNAPSSFTYKLVVVKSGPEEQRPLEIAPTNPPQGQTAR